MDLCEPPGEEEWEGSAALEAKLLEMASQAYLHYISPIAPLYLRSISAISPRDGLAGALLPARAHAPLSPPGRRDHGAGRLAARQKSSRRSSSLVAGGSLVGWRPWDGVWRVAAVMRAAVAAPPTLLPRRSTDASAPPASTQVYCNALALYEDATEQRHRGAAPAKARGRAPTVPAPTVPAPSVRAPTVPAASVPAPSPRVGAEVGMGLSASVAMLNHRCDPNVDWGLDASGGRARTRCPPFRRRPPPGTAGALGGGAPPGARLVALGRSSHWLPPRGEATCRGAPPLASALGGSSYPRAALSPIPPLC